MTGLSGRPAGAEGEGHNPDSRVVGEREERLREENAQLRDELRALRPVLDEVKPRPDELIARVDAALASSPSPPDREQAVEKVLAWMPPLHPNITQDRREIAEEIVAALFGPVREDDVQERPDEADRHLRILEGLGKPTPSDPFQAEQLLDAVRRMVAAETALLREALFGPVRGDES
jgi:hypothetical protein